MLTDQEKSFLDAVAKHYLAPLDGYRLNRTKTVADAAYFAAKELGAKVPTWEPEQEEFFRSFMGGLMFRTEGQAYLNEAIQAVKEAQKQRAEERVEHRIAVTEAAQKQLDIILAAAQEIQRLTSSLRHEHRLFSKHSAEMNALRGVERRIAEIKNSAAADENRGTYY